MFVKGSLGTLLDGSKIVTWLCIIACMNNMQYEFHIYIYIYIYACLIY